MVTSPVQVGFFRAAQAPHAPGKAKVDEARRRPEINLLKEAGERGHALAKARPALSVARADASYGLGAACCVA